MKHIKHINHPQKYLIEQRDKHAALLERTHELLLSLHIASLEHAIPKTLGAAESMELSTLLNDIREAKTQAFMDKHAHPTKGQPVYVWSRDCECVESDRVVWIHPEAGELDELTDQTEESAEGPYSISMITQEQAADFEPTYRDRIMEAYENGRGSSHYV